MSLGSSIVFVPGNSYQRESPGVPVSFGLAPHCGEAALRLSLEDTTCTGKETLFSVACHTSNHISFISREKIHHAVGCFGETALQEHWNIHFVFSPFQKRPRFSWGRMKCRHCHETGRETALHWNTGNVIAQNQSEQSTQEVFGTCWLIHKNPVVSY